MNGALTRRSLRILALWIAGGSAVAVVASSLACSSPPPVGQEAAAPLLWEPLARADVQGWTTIDDRIFAAAIPGEAVLIDPATGQVGRLPVIAGCDAIPALFGYPAIPASPIFNLTPAVAVAPDGAITLAGGTEESEDSVFLLSTDSGRTWDRPASSKSGVLSAATFTPNAGVIVGPAGAILRSADNGRSWTEVSRSTDLDIFAVAALPSGVVIAVGDQGLVLRSTDHGKTWSGRAFGRQPLYGVAIADDGRTVVATGRAGTVLRSPDGGATFAPVGLGDSPEAMRLPAFASVALDTSVGGVLITCGTDDGRVFSRAASGTWSEVRLDEGAIMHLARTRAGLLAASTTGTVYIARTRK